LKPEFAASGASQAPDNTAASFFDLPCRHIEGAQKWSPRNKTDLTGSQAKSTNIENGLLWHRSKQGKAYSHK
jgi:hypothetical protein